MIVIAHPGITQTEYSGPRRPFYYFADPKGDGWCGPLRETRLEAVLDGRRHRAAMAATRDERR